MNTGRWIIGMSGASGMRYALRLLSCLNEHPDIRELHVVISEAGLRVLSEEENIKLSFSALSTKTLINQDSSKITFYNIKDIGASIASGSFITDGMVVVPTSMATVGAISHGMPQNLLQRAADVVLKEKRRLILVPRETPLSSIHLENLLKLSQMGTVILPAMPGFYHKPTALEDIVDMLVMKIMDSMGLDNQLVSRWERNIKNLQVLEKAS
jgi:flavin prenyltransferase